MGSTFSFAVYDRYLDRLNELRKSDLSKIYDACVLMKRLKSDCDAFLTAVDSESPPEELRMRAFTIIQLSRRCHELMIDALQTFEGGESFLKEQTADRGSSIAGLRELSEAFSRGS